MAFALVINGQLLARTRISNDTSQLVIGRTATASLNGPRTTAI